jgi:hypothetical protein
MGKIPFQLKKFADYGSSHPAAARLFLQMTDLLNVADINEPTKDQVRQHLFRCGDEMVKAQRKRDAFLAKCRQFSEDVRTGRGIVAQQHALEIHEPEGLADDFRQFLSHLAAALRMAVKATALILLGRSEGWKPVRQAIERQFPIGHPLREVLQRHMGWTKSFFDTRGEVEHDPYLFEGFKVEPSASGMLRVVDPKMPDGSSAVTTMGRYYEDGFAFIEEFVVRAIEIKFSKVVTLQEIPEHQRNPGKPVRYIARLPGLGPCASHDNASEGVC